ncbi:clasp N terminal-domain-containing protein [Sporodiniella umbellata]|nr:clasp N terminal-domain-containing protein [Sporodiniella umbellata]
MSTKKDLKAQFQAIPQLFNGNENDGNWEKRNKCIRTLHSLLTCESFTDLEALFLTQLKPVVCQTLKPIFSLRSSHALDCLNFFGDVGLHLGAKMDNSMAESILTQLIQCCATSKKIILNKTNEVINTFLINVRFNLRLITIMCNNMQQKNTPLRNSAALALKTILEHHGQKAKEKLVSGKGEASLLQESILKGVSDASPEVRKTCRDILAIYKTYWPKEAESARLVKNNEASGLSKITKRKSALPKEGSLRPQKKARPDNNDALSRLSQISYQSAPAALAKQHSTGSVASLVPRNAKSVFHEQQAIEIKLVLQLLSSEESEQKCKGIYKLAEKLRTIPYNARADLPADVPPRLTLLPVLMDFLTKRNCGVKVSEALMSWESITGIFSHIMSPQYYIPTLIILDQETKDIAQHDIFSHGLSRVKLFLNEHEPELVPKLLELLECTYDISNSKLIDASVKRDVQLIPRYKYSLQRGIIEWLNEVLCLYMDIPILGDKQETHEASRWMNFNSSCPAKSWFTSNKNFEKIMDCVVRLVNTEQEDLVPSLQSIIANLKTSNMTSYKSYVASTGKREEDLLRYLYELPEEKEAPTSHLSILDENVESLFMEEIDFSLLDPFDSSDDDFPSVTVPREGYSKFAGETQKNLGNTEESSKQSEPTDNIKLHQETVPNTKAEIEKVSPALGSKSEITHIENENTKNLKETIEHTVEDAAKDIIENETPEDKSNTTKKKADKEFTGSNTDNTFEKSAEVSLEAVVEELKMNNTTANDASKTETSHKLYTSNKNPTYKELSSVAQRRARIVQNCIGIMKLGHKRLLSCLELRRVLENSSIVDLYKIDEDSAFWLCNFACDFRSYLSLMTDQLLDNDLSWSIKREVVKNLEIMLINQKALFLRYLKFIPQGGANRLYKLIGALTRLTPVSPDAKRALSSLLLLYPRDASDTLIKDSADHNFEQSSPFYEVLMSFVSGTSQKQK